MGIKTAVAISAKTSAVVHLAGKRALNLRSVFYIASEGDQGGKRAEWALELFEKTASPKKIEIVKHHSGHGVTILQESPEVWEKILTWLEETL